MKAGRTLVELAQEIERQKETKVDYMVNPTVMHMAGVGNNIMMEFDNREFYIRQLAHRQIGTKLNIPAKYYDLMAEQAPQLLAINVNSWLSRETEHRLIRTLDGDMRAFLSKGYRPLDNYDLAEAVLPILNQMECTVKSCEITENKFYIKAVTEKITGEVTKGDIVQSGICISNSEVGLGSLSIEPLIYRLVCQNGMIAADYSVRKNHVGRRTVDNVDVTEFYRDATRRTDDKAFWMKVQDLVTHSMTQIGFGNIVNSMREATQRQITGDPVKVVENISAKFSMTDNEQSSVLRHLINFGDLTQYALSNAITRMSQEVESYDRCTDLERAGGDVIALKPTEWRVINAA